MKEGETEFLKQLVRSLESAYPKLEKAYSEGNSREFERIKKIINTIQKKILEISI